MADWKKRILGVFIIRHGEFSVNEDNVLIKEEDFLSVYDLIESVGRLKLRSLRAKNEENRRPRFISAFFQSESSD